MNTLMPCGLDDDRCRLEPDGPEDTDPRTDAEKRIEWICEEWQSVLDKGDDDTYEDWRDIRMMAYGAKQALNQNNGFTARQDYLLFDIVGDLAFLNGVNCIQNGKYEGAKK